MGSFSIWHWLIVLVVVVLIFGTKKLRNMGTDLGGAVKGFKDGMKTEDDKDTGANGGAEHPGASRAARPSKAKSRTRANRNGLFVAKASEQRVLDFGVSELW